MKQLIKLSFSRVDTYNKCPRKYYYTYINKLPRKEWDHFSLGTLVHEALEFFHEKIKNKFDFDNTDIKKHMSVCFKKAAGVSKNELKKETLDTAKQLLLGYLKCLKKKFDGEILYLEKEFNIKLKNSMSIMGYIDRIDKDDDGIYHVKDYKTSKDDKYMKPDQLQVYGLHLLELYPNIKKFRGSFIMLKLDSKYVTYDFNRDDVEKMRLKLIQNGDNILDEQRWVQNPSKLCDWCDFKETCENSW